MPAKCEACGVWTSRFAMAVVFAFVLGLLTLTIRIPPHPVHTAQVTPAAQR